jgi:glycosyltransferase involved in cell wall biosynthesis
MWETWKWLNLRHWFLRLKKYKLFCFRIEIMNPILSIVTINLNNANGLSKTMESVFNQTSIDFEYIVIDGGSTDNSLDVINHYRTLNSSIYPNIPFIFISESDNGIYSAMNKGIHLSKGEYIHFLNSGDVLVHRDVTKNMLYQLPNCDIIYGNMLKVLANGKILYNRKMEDISFLSLYNGAINHPAAYTKRILFEIYGFYDETLKIVSDWKWYLEVIVLHNVVPVYKDVDVTFFDMNGISSTNSQLDQLERRKVLEELFPILVLRDYDLYAFPIEQYNRLNSYWITRKVFYFIERVLFKLEKYLK